MIEKRPVSSFSSTPRERKSGRICSGLRVSRFALILLFLLLLAVPLISQAELDDCPQAPMGTIGHTYGSWQTVAPTCTEGGYDYCDCVYCGDRLINNETRPLDHTWNNGVTTTAPSCEANGVLTYTCTRCGTTRTESIPATGHSPTVLSAVSASCETGGKTDGTQCAVCGAILIPQQDLPALGHDWDQGSVTASPTCTADGVRTYTCARCGATRTEGIPATGHTPTVLPAVAASCETGGRTEGSQCSVCGAVLTAQQDTPALGHDWDWGYLSYSPTCTMDGAWTYTCTRCGATTWESIPATGHSPEVIPAVPASCEAGGKTEGSQCSVCGTVLTPPQDTPALGHAWDNGAVTTAPTCIGDGVKTYTCSRCGLTWRDIVPATGHSPVVLPAVAAGCETGGKTEGSQCAVCGTLLIAQQDIPALGHAWNGGIITRQPTEEEYGERTYTCTRCGATRKERISATGPQATQEPPPSSFQIFHLDLPLTIVTQPYDGSISHFGGDSHTLTVEVIGGKPAYIYEWHWKPFLQNSSTVPALASAQWESIQNSYSDILHSVASSLQAVAASQLHSSLEGLSPESIGISLQAKPDADVLDVSVIVGDNSPTYEATVPGDYYCIISDQAGEKVYTYTVEVFERVYVAEQPQNQNLYGKSYVTLSCKATSGKPINGSYLYAWVDPNGNLLEVTDHGSQEVTEPGEYYCMIDDMVESIVSDMVTVYSTDPFTCLTPPRAEECVSFKNVTLSASFQGGTPPYTVTWNLDSVEIPTEADESGSTFSIKLEDDRFGVYTCVGTDAMGETASTSISMQYLQLSIAEHPQGGFLPDSGEGLPMKIRMAGGKAPFTYTLYRNKEAILTGTEGDAFSANVSTPGVYYYHVEDAEGRWADSLPADVQYYHFRLIDYTRQADITVPSVGAKLVIETEGGLPPIQYRWTWEGANPLFDVEESETVLTDQNTFTAKVPGFYHCDITDSKDTVLYAYGIYVSQTDDYPLIVVQPENSTIREGYHSIALTCKAVTYSTNDDTDLNYEWFTGNGSSVGKGPSLTVSETDDIVTRRRTVFCRVTNRISGKFVNSVPVRVGAPIEIIERSLSGGTITLVFEGGIPPYQIMVFIEQKNAFIDPYDFKYHVKDNANGKGQTITIDGLSYGQAKYDSNVKRYYSYEVDIIDVTGYGICRFASADPSNY